MKTRGLFVALTLVFLSATAAQAQTASQAYRVVVPSSLAIVAPAGQIMTHDQTTVTRTSVVNVGPSKATYPMAWP